ncbi:DUF92 domain-containing protein [Mucilaginibacter terrenus]|uniref:DUF92 domain-containing protein n=1 Tax=Mucilaginibacter terrenus TaxID=2482727 RepID=A0A3E2NV36_9SPHI|nr:DUF92 domain-containing protein [Mucilaginibacter terrenus]RFZ84886.1 DUF92 domain-containing protein [Mucilaginibacter terrenus]
MYQRDIIFSAILIGATTAVYKTRKLTLAGSFTGATVAICLYLGFLVPGVSILAVFFVMATVATSWQKRKKAAAIKDTHQEKRDAYQVVANGGVAAIMGLFNLFVPSLTPYFVIMAAAMASATADTLSSELGTVYGKRFYNVITFKPDERGRDGVISLEGTLIGVAGAAAIAVVFASYGGAAAHAIVIVIAGTAGNLMNSLLGAALERKGYLSNNMVNFLNTAFAAFIAWLLVII